ncbi:MAG: acyl transferase, partial [Myxococcales bacterium]|nr:acyl transferase [Myxococcales bacterium]
MKLVLALEHELLPKTLHAENPSSYIDWSSGNIALLQEPRAWSPGPRQRRGAVSSFGISGTNAHVIIGEAPPAPDTTRRDRILPAALPVLLSGRSEAALRAQVQSLVDFGQRRPDIDWADLCFSLATTRTHFEYRTCILTGSFDQELAGLASNGVAPNTTTAFAKVTPSLVAMFTGQGSQRPGMGKELH